MLIGIDEVGRGSFAGPVLATAVLLDEEETIFDAILLKNSHVLDSKKLSREKRESIYQIAIENDIQYASAISTVDEINEINITNATLLAMCRALKDLSYKIQKNELGKEVIMGKRVMVEKKIMIEKRVIIGKAIAEKITTEKIWEMVDGIVVDGNINPLSSRVTKYVFDDEELKNIQKMVKTVIGGDALYKSVALASIIAKVKRDEIMRNLHKRNEKYLWDKNKGYGTQEHINRIRLYGVSEDHRKNFIRKI